MICPCKNLQEIFKSRVPESVILVLLTRNIDPYNFAHNDSLHFNLMNRVTPVISISCQGKESKVVAF